MLGKLDSVFRIAFESVSVRPAVASKSHILSPRSKDLTLTPSTANLPICTTLIRRYLYLQKSAYHFSPYMSPGLESFAYRTISNILLFHCYAVSILGLTHVISGI